MKHLFSLLFVLFAIAGSAQKPLKTFDEKKFAKKVILSLDPSLIHKVSPDAEDIKYISEVLKISEERVKKEIAETNEEAAKDAKWLNDNKVWRKLESVEIKNDENEKGIRTADIVLHCSYQGKNFDLVLKECFQTKRSWYLGRRIIPEGEEIEDIVKAYRLYKYGPEVTEEMIEESGEVEEGVEGTEEVSEAEESGYDEAVEEGGEAEEAGTDGNEESADESFEVGESVFIPEEFTELVGKWTFKAVYDGEKDMTSQYTDGFIEGKPIKMYILPDGNLYYQKEYREKNKIMRSTWEYVKAEDRKERQKDIDFEITTYYDREGSNRGTEKYTLVSATKDELVYENKMLKMKWVWTK
jgi:hypothetical protein